MYEITDGNETHDAETRKEAIKMARDLSQSSYNQVIVEDEHDCERLTYKNGDLMKYWYDTRGKRN
jgi:hypothetical protein